MTRLNIQAEASADAYEAAVWYEGQRAGLGLECILELDAALERATASPQLYATQYRDARRALLRRFPCAIYFVYRSGRGVVFGDVGQVRITCGRGGTGVAEQALNMTQAQAVFEQMSGKAVSKGMYRHLLSCCRECLMGTGSIC